VVTGQFLNGGDRRDDSEKASYACRPEFRVAGGLFPYWSVESRATFHDATSRRNKKWLFLLSSLSNAGDILL